MTLEEKDKKFTELFDDGVYEAVNLDRCVSFRTSEGGPAPENVLREAKRVKSLI